MSSKMKNEIETYIKQNETEGALLITGDWGCGKTYFLNSLIQKNKEKNKSEDADDYVYALISLYGIDSVDALHQEVKKVVLEAQSISNEKDNTLMSKFKKIALPISEALKENNAIAGAVNVALQINPFDFIEIENKVTSYGTDINQGVKKRLVLVFDDLERCKIDISDLLGAINYYLEGKKIKTIIVANEQKLKDYDSKNDYLEFKEKTILSTLFFKQDSELIISCFLDDYNETPKDNSFVKVLREQVTIPMLCNVFEESSCNNYRLFKRALINAERYFNILQEYDSSLIEKNIYKYALYQFIAVFMEYQISNIEVNQFEKFYKQGLPFSKYTNFTFSFLPKFTQNCIYKGEWDNDSHLICDAIKKINKYKLMVEHSLNAEKFFKDEGSSDVLLPSAIYVAENNALQADELITLFKNIKSRKENGQETGNINYAKVAESISNGNIPAHFYNSIMHNTIDEAMKSVEEAAIPALEALRKRKSIYWDI